MIKPFADDSASASIGGLTVENGRDRVLLYGNAELTRDKAGLQQARDLRALLDQVVHALEADTTLPDAVAPPRKPGTIKNPFG